MMDKNTVNILGTEYSILKQTEADNKKLRGNDGLLEQWSKEIILNDFEITDDIQDNIDAYKRKVLRHEIVHAYFTESGLHGESAYAENEELVDWIANMLPKMIKTCEELKITD